MGRRIHHQRRSYSRLMYIGIFVLLVAVTIGAYHFFANSGNKSKNDPGEISTGNEVHIMIMGVDRREDDVGRSDTLMVVTLNEKTNQTILLSIPRDTLVNIPGRGYDKINHAYAYGGHELTQKAVEKLLGVKMDHYILMDTRAFEKIVDAMGGIDINVDKRMYYEDPWDDDGGLIIDIFPGEQHMDGETAIQYVRYRDAEGDLGRIGRQQKFLASVMDQLITPSIVGKLPALTEQVAKAVESDMSAPELLVFAKKIKDIRSNGVDSTMVPGKAAYYDGVSYWVPNIMETRELLAQGFGIEMTKAMRESASAAAAEYEREMPKDMKLSTDDKAGSPEDRLKSDKSMQKPKKLTNGKADAKQGKQDVQDKKDKPDKNDNSKQTAQKPADISVRVENCSGISGAGAEVADILQRRGFIISEVGNGSTSELEKTSITTSSANTDLFYGMPFDCIIRAGGGAGQAVVRIGRDYQ